MPPRILFVDDEPQILETYRRVLEPLRPDWDLQFAASGPEALVHAAAAPLDIAVADIQMPGMDGQVLLSELRRRQPDAVRFAVVAAGAGRPLHRLVAVAHRILTKPCEPAELVEVLARALALKGVLRHPGLAAAVSRAGALPSLSAVYSELSDALAGPDCPLATVAGIIGRDLGMATKLLQVANSVAFGTRGRIVELADAVRRIGLSNTRNLVLATAVFSRYDPAALAPYSIDDLWAHSLAVSGLARAVARAEGLDPLRAGEAALGGLMHDIGRLVLAALSPAEYRVVLDRTGRGDRAAIDAERDIFGVGHPEVGGYLLDLWGLPAGIVEAVTWHHAPADCPGVGFTPAAAVHVADALLDREGGGVCNSRREHLGGIDRLPVWETLRDEIEAHGSPAAP